MEIMIRKNIYKWHRICSLIIAIPVILSAVSGFMHPIMTNLRPTVAAQGLRPIAIDSSQIAVSLSAALDSNHIDSIGRFRIVHIDTNWFYQVQRGMADEPVYLSTKTGKRLPNGDWLYAQWLARQFLEGPVKERKEREMVAIAVDLPSTIPDCCSAATSAVINAKGSKVLDVERLTSFDVEYSEINRLLPVQKVSFARPDSMRIYVETTQDRFALAVDQRRAIFNKVFQFIHTYKFFDFLGAGKQVVEFLLMAIAFLTTVMGIYIFFSTRSRKVPGNAVVKARRNHRYTAIVISLFTLMFTFSGGYHALSKLKPDDRNAYFVRDRFAARDLQLDFGRLATGRLVTGVGIVRMGAQSYWRLTGGASAVYVNVKDGEVLPDGERQYARYLATQFSTHPQTAVVGVSPVVKFDRDYNFTDKRLPVWKVSYNQNGNERYYVETSTGRLSVRVTDADLIEGYSFALLHKHEFLGGIGKWAKDTSTMFWAAAQLFMVALGLILYFKKFRSR